MTAYIERLLEEAHEYWDRGESVPLTLFAQMTREGLDVEGLEIKHKKEEL